MANIFCTKKLERLVGKSLMESTPKSSELGNWNANIFPLQGRKCLIITNDITYYSLLFLDILKKDILNFHELFVERMIEQLDYDQINFHVEWTPKLMNELKPRFLPTNNNRKVLGTMNEFAFETEYHIYHSYNGQLQRVNLPELNNKITKSFVGALKPKKWDFGLPVQEMDTMLNKIYA